MQTQNLDLNKMGLAPITESEMVTTNGGGDGFIFPMGTGGSNPADAGGATVTAVRAVVEAKAVWDFVKWAVTLLE